MIDFRGLFLVRTKKQPFSSEFLHFFFYYSVKIVLYDGNSKTSA